MAAASKSLTQEVAEYASGVSYGSIPADVIQRAKQAMIDGLGVIVAGCNSDAAFIIGRYLEELGVSGKASVVGGSLMLPAQFAALANGTSGHAVDYDDTQLSSAPERVYGLLTHPTIPVLAASLAVAEEPGAGGKDLLTAFCAGVKVACKVARKPLTRGTIRAASIPLVPWGSLAPLRPQPGSWASPPRLPNTPSASPPVRAQA